MTANATASAPPPAVSPRKLLAWRVSAEHARHWANGILTDFALKLAEQPDGEAFFLHTIEGRAAWRDVVNVFRGPRPPRVAIFRARHPITERHALRAGARPSHRDEWANRFYCDGAVLARLTAHIPK